MLDPERLRGCVGGGAVTGELHAVIQSAPTRTRTELKNSGWVRHTLEAAVWRLLTTDRLEDAVVQVVNLGNDADTAGSVVGALASAAYGLEAVPTNWLEVLRGEGLLHGGRWMKCQDLILLADKLAEFASH